jgi:hypothetical protein
MLKHNKKQTCVVQPQGTGEAEGGECENVQIGKCANEVGGWWLGCLSIE